jgi:hypothetical protein
MSLLKFAAVFLMTIVSAAQTSTPTKSEKALWEPPVLDWPDELPRATVPKPMITNLTVAGMPIQLEGTKLVDAERRFGATIGHRGDAGESLYWVCLLGAGQNGRWLLWLESSEVDGGLVGGFLLRSIPTNAKADLRCRTLSTRESRIDLPIRLRLGMSESEVRKTLGTITARKGDTLIFDHEHEQLFDGTPFTVSNTVAVLLNNKSVSAIQVWSTSTN